MTGTKACSLVIFLFLLFSFELRLFLMMNFSHNFYMVFSMCFEVRDWMKSACWSHRSFWFVWMLFFFFIVRFFIWTRKLGERRIWAMCFKIELLGFLKWRTLDFSLASNWVIRSCKNRTSNAGSSTPLCNVVFSSGWGGGGSRRKKANALAERRSSLV